jgi:polyferredoxin
MRKGWLKKFRVVTSLLFFFIIGAMFIDFTGKAVASFLHFTLHLQFVPSLIRFLATLAPVALGFALIILITLLFGRVYCSFICPLGTLHDIFIFFSKKLAPRKKLWKYRKPLNLIRYGLTGLIILSLVTGSILLVNIFDPYSLYGKIVHNLARPVFIGGNNLAALLLTKADVFLMYPVNWVPVNYAALILAVGWTVMLLILSATRGRLYCNTICPVGTLLGVFSQISLFRIRLDKSACNSCGKCSSVCKAECIDPKAQSLDFSRCVGCMNCLSPCPDNGVRFMPVWKANRPADSGSDKSRRQFIRNTGLIVAGGLGSAKVLMAQEDKKKEVIPGTVPIFREHPVTPPGALGQDRFNSLCTACQLCVSACPTLVLQPTYLMYGLKGFLQPRMDYITSFCNFECTLCGEVCPTGAILPLPLEQKKLVQLGKAKFVKENCVVFTRNTDCGACSEHCPTKAVQMIPYQGKLTIPEVTENICIGCGACEYACPTDPKSIYVDGNPVHLVAEKPREEKLDQEIDYKEEFPF